MRIDRILIEFLPCLLLVLHTMLLCYLPGRVFIFPSLLYLLHGTLLLRSWLQPGLAGVCWESALGLLESLPPKLASPPLLRASFAASPARLLCVQKEMPESVSKAWLSLIEPPLLGSASAVAVAGIPSHRGSIDCFAFQASFSGDRNAQPEPPLLQTARPRFPGFLASPRTER